MALTKASGKIEYSRRDIFVSSYPGAAGGVLAEPIAVRIRNSTDEDVTSVRCRLDVNWKPGELQQWLETVSDFVLILDDEICMALKSLERVDDTPGHGLELVVVLGVNDARAQGGDGEPVRLWLAKAEGVRMVALQKVARRPEWNLDARDREGLLHWLYERDEKILAYQDKLENKKFIGKDETRLSASVDRFVDHAPQLCPTCGTTHPRA